MNLKLNPAKISNAPEDSRYDDPQTIDKALEDFNQSATRQESRSLTYAPPTKYNKIVHCYRILTLLHYSCHNLATTWVSQLPILFVNSTHSVEYIATLNFSKTPLLKVLKFQK